MNEITESLTHRGWPWEIKNEKLTASLDQDAFPRITIVTPSYNQADTLEETIRSVIFQGYPNLEYMVIDGGSSDGSVDIIRKYESHLAYWVSEKDRGQSHAINKGWQRGTGELFAWLNSDDYLGEDVLQHVADTYCQSQSKNAGLIYGRANVINSKREILTTIGEPFDFAFSFSNLIDVFPQPSVFITRQSLNQVGMVDETMHYAMDFDLFLRASLNLPAVFVDEIWSFFRYYPDTKTSRNPLGFIEDHFRMIDKIQNHQEYREKINPLRNAALASNYIRSARIHLEKGQKKEALLNIWKALQHNMIFTVRKEIRILIKGRHSKI